MATNPGMVPQILGRVGLPAMLDWLRHLAGLTLFTFLHWDVQVGARAAAVPAAPAGITPRGGPWPDTPAVRCVCLCQPSRSA